MDLETEALRISRDGLRELTPPVASSVGGVAITVGRAVLLAIAGGLVTALWLGIKLHVLRQP